jgi:hypothetical protein
VAGLIFNFDYESLIYLFVYFNHVTKTYNFKFMDTTDLILSMGCYFGGLIDRLKFINLPQGLPLGRKSSRFFGRPGNLKFSLEKLEM